MKSFKEITEDSPNTVLIVDALNLGFRWKHSKAIDFKEDYMRTVDSLKKSYKASKVIIAADWGSSTYRKALYPDYKQNRKDKYEEQSEAEKAEFEAFFAEMQKIYEAYETEGKYTFFRFAGVEADDIAAYVVKKRKKFGFQNIWLASSDKDWDLLISEGVSRFSYVTRKEITIDNWSEHYEYEPEDHISIKCLQGDAGDNIPGVTGVGPKKAQQLVREYGTAYDIMANLPIQSKYKYIQSLNQFGAENIELNYRLMDLLEFCEDAIGEENINTINKVLENAS